MYTLKPSQYDRVVPLITAENDVTVQSALHGIINSEVMVDDAVSPTCALLKLPGTNYVMGNTDNRSFNEMLSTKLDFWDPLTPDNDAWCSIIPQCHPNSYIRRYTRCHYELSKNDWKDTLFAVPPEYVIEKVDVSQIRKHRYENADKLLDWTGDYCKDRDFMKDGTGCYVRHADKITNWSLSDGHYREKIAIGVQSDERFRRKGLSVAAVAATIKECFRKGFSTIEWLCVDFNKGSRAIAEKLGFRLVNTYYSFTPYPPCENYHDLSEQDWNEWADYYEKYSLNEPRLLGEQLLARIKGNHNQKAKETICIMKEKYGAAVLEENQWIAKIPNTIDYFHSIGMCSALSSEEWASILCRLSIL